MLDSPGLVEEDYIRDEHHTEYEHWTPLEGGAIEFVNSIAQGLVHYLVSQACTESLLSVC